MNTIMNEGNTKKLRVSNKAFKYELQARTSGATKQMKKLIIISFIASLVIGEAYSQNLIPNYSFETYSSCPSSANQLFRASPWFNPSLGTPDYYHACSTSGAGVPYNGLFFHYARSGGAVVGIVCWSIAALAREYLEVGLMDTLHSNKEYYIEFYVSFIGSPKYAISNIGLYLSDTAIYSSTVTNFPFVPQIENPAGNFLTDTVNWIRISGMYTAHGGEKFITIGNFRDDANTDTLAANPSQYGYSYYLVDDVTVIDADSVQGLHEQSKISFTISPNPASEVLKITLPPNVSSTAFTIINTMGTIVKQEESTALQNETVIDIANLPRGVYLIKVKTNKGVGYKKLLKM